MFEHSTSFFNTVRYDNPTVPFPPTPVVIVTVATTPLGHHYRRSPNVLDLVDKVLE